MIGTDCVLPSLICPTALNCCVSPVSSEALVGVRSTACNVGGGDPDALRDKLAILKQHCDTLGRDYASIIKSTDMFVFPLEPGEDPEAGSDRQHGRVRLDDPYDLGAEFYRWEFATAVAGSILGINPFDQPDVQAAKDKTAALLSQGTVPEPGPEGSLDELLAEAEPPQYIAIQAFVDPEREGEIDPLVTRARETGCVVTKGLGPRYLHSTGQLHKGGPNTVLAIQVVDDLGEELPIPGKDFGFRRLIAAQATGDLESLKERGRKVCRVRLEEL